MLKTEVKSKITEQKKLTIREIDASLDENLARLVNQARDKGASSWLTVNPNYRQDMVLNKSEFQDALRIRYGLRLENLPSTCVCGTKFDLEDALQCKKGGFISQRHDEIKTCWPYV